LPWGYQPQVRALSAFLTLSGPCSARSLPALFHAGPALGVHSLQGRSPPAEPCDLSAASALLGLTVVKASSRPPGRWNLLGETLRAGSSFEETTLLTTAPLQGFAPCERPCLGASGLNLPFDRDPHGILLLRGFSLLTGDPPRVHPLTGLVIGAHARPIAAPQSVVPAKRSAGLPRVCRPSRGSPPCRPSR